MNRALPFAVLALAACGPQFRGERGVGFDSSLGHQYVAWTPAQAVARGTSVTFTHHPEPCFIDCPPAVFYRGRAESGTALRETSASLDRVSAVAAETGPGVVSWVSLDAGSTDRFVVRVTEAAGVRLTDPLAFNQRVYPDFIGFDGGTWPDVDDTVVMGPGGALYLEVLVLDDAGRSLGYSAAELATSASGDGWQATTAGMQVDVRSPDAGSGTVEVAWGDAGVSRTFAVSVSSDGHVEQVLVQRVSTQRFVLKADVRTPDGRSLFEPELVWEPEPGFVELDTLKLAGLRPRRDVKVYDFFAADAGAYDAGVVVRLGTQSLRVPLDPVVFEVTQAPAAPAAPPRGCGCASSPLPLLLLAALVVRALRNKQIASGF